MKRKEKFNPKKLEKLYTLKGISRKDKKIVEAIFIEMYNVGRSKYGIEGKTTYYP